jgi:hypothetical protein
MPALARVVTREDLDAIGCEALSILETEGESGMQKFLDQAVSSFRCSTLQARQITTACSTLINLKSIKL